MKKREIWFQRSRLHRRLFEEAEALLTWANRLDRKRRSGAVAARWKARGSQAALRAAAREFKALGMQHATSYVLSIALKEYLLCLQISLEDAQEEARGSRYSRRTPVERWKASGEARVLTRICARVCNLVDCHALSHPLHVLSADGTMLLDLQEDAARSVADPLSPAAIHR